MLVCDRIEPGREDEVRHSSRVLGLVIVEFSLGDQLENGQSGQLSVQIEHAHGDLGSTHEPLCEDRAELRTHFLQMARQLVTILALDHAETRALVDRLDHDREAELRLDPGRRIRHGFVTIYLAEIRRGHAARPGDLLGGDLVHAQRGGEHSGAGIRDAHHFEQSLDGAVLAVATVKRQEGDLHVVLPELLPDIPQRVDPHRPVSTRPQSGKTVLAGNEGYFPFAGQAAHEYADGLSLQVHAGNVPQCHGSS